KLPEPRLRIRYEESRIAGARKVRIERPPVRCGRLCVLLQDYALCVQPLRAVPRRCVAVVERDRQAGCKVYLASVGPSYRERIGADFVDNATFAISISH